MGRIFIRFDQLYVHPSPVSTVRLAVFHRPPAIRISFPFRRWAPWLRDVPALSGCSLHLRFESIVQQGYIQESLGSQSVEADFLPLAGS